MHSAYHMHMVCPFCTLFQHPLRGHAAKRSSMTYFVETQTVPRVGTTSISNPCSQDQQLNGSPGTSGSEAGAANNAGQQASGVVLGAAAVRQTAAARGVEGGPPMMGVAAGPTPIERGYGERAMSIPNAMQWAASRGDVVPGHVKRHKPNEVGQTPPHTAQVVVVPVQGLWDATMSRVCFICLQLYQLTQNTT